VTGNTINVTLYNVVNRQTSIDQVVDALNNAQSPSTQNPPTLTAGTAASANLISAASLTVGQNKNAVGFATQPGYSPFQLGGGKNPTTVQDLVSAINSAGVNVTASFTPSSQAGTIIGDEISELSKPVPPGPRGPYIAGTQPIQTLTLGGGAGATGFTTGLAFGPDANTLYGVSEFGQFFRVDIDIRPGSFSVAQNATD